MRSVRSCPSELRFPSLPEHHTGFVERAGVLPDSPFQQPGREANIASTPNPGTTGSGRFPAPPPFPPALCACEMCGTLQMNPKPGEPSLLFPARSCRGGVEPGAVPRPALGGRCAALAARLWRRRWRQQKGRLAAREAGGAQLLGCRRCLLPGDAPAAAARECVRGPRGAAAEIHAVTPLSTNHHTDLPLPTPSPACPSPAAAAPPPPRQPKLPGLRPPRPLTVGSPFPSLAPSLARAPPAAAPC